VGGACERGGKCTIFGGETRRKEITRKTVALMGGWYQNGTYGDSLWGGWSALTWLRIGINCGLL
jgi:hypothetical protein